MRRLFARKSPVPEPETPARPPRETDPLDDAGPDELRAEIDRLTASNREARDPAAEHRLIVLRHLLGVRLLDAPAAAPQHPEPDTAALPDTGELPEIAAADLTPELLRAGILRDGCVLVRGLIARDEALELADAIDRSFAERERVLEGAGAAEGFYDEFRAGLHRFPPIDSREWIRAGGGVLAGDSPRATFRVLETLQAAGFPALVERYLGEPPVVTFEKTTLRKADPSVGGAWHQDGHFLGQVRALNLWLSLSRCGDESPGLDLVPRRLDELVTAGGPEAVLSYVVTDADAHAAARPKAVVRPIFEPGDALLFDELFLHQTGSDPSMPKPRYALESWFFGASAFPAFHPIAV